MIDPKPYAIEFAEGKKIEFLHEVMVVPASEEREEAFRPPHLQDYFELVYFNAGARDIRIGEKVHSFRAGDVMIVRPDEEHASRNVSCVLDRYYLHIPPDAFELLSDGAALTSMFTDRDRYEGNLLRMNGEQQKALRELMTRLDWIMRFSESATRNAEALACVIRILILTAEAAGSSGKRTPERSDLLLRILSLMESSFASADVIRDVQMVFGLSRSSLWRLFRSEMDITPSRYLQNVRLENARRMISGGSSVQETAMGCGFSDSSHLIRLFRERYGETPLKYRRGHEKG